jgi:hypothetical protein
MLLVLIESCSTEEKPICWRCTEKTTINYSVGKDTSFIHLSLDCRASEAEIKAAETERTKTIIEDIGGGVIKTTTVQYYCLEPSKIK